MPSCGMLLMPLARKYSILSAFGAQPLALIPFSFPVFASQYIAKRSPPIPSLFGSTTPSTALAAIAASIADPPRARICAPACEAKVWLVATIPWREITIERACVRSWASVFIEQINTAAHQAPHRFEPPVMDRNDITVTGAHL